MEHFGGMIARPDSPLTGANTLPGNSFIRTSAGLHFYVIIYRLVLAARLVFFTAARHSRIRCIVISNYLSSQFIAVRVDFDIVIFGFRPFYFAARVRDQPLIHEGYVLSCRFHTNSPPHCASASLGWHIPCSGPSRHECSCWCLTLGGCRFGGCVLIRTDSGDRVFFEVVTAPTRAVQVSADLAVTDQRTS